eukprot:TRINITY_DN1677_c0_g3_i1.p1 TRINITY_DN1677_c0_g3~~TRINITY_DN1677_c0_g3_i1.p1  ORF type:complete len:102 (-),score=2.57 TRINITY_DN1677_c0_g3_i1:121-426(-)
MTGLDGVRCTVESRLPSQGELQLEFLRMSRAALGASGIVLYISLINFDPTDGESGTTSLRGLFLIFVGAIGMSRQDARCTSEFARVLFSRLAVSKMSSTSS